MSTKRMQTLTASGMILLECLFWGLGNPLLKIGLGVIPTFWCLSIRFVATFILVMLLFRKKLKHTLTRKTAVRCMPVSLFSAAAYLFAAWGLARTQATIAGFLMSLAVLFTPILSFLVYREKMRAVQWLPIAVVIGGMWLLCAGTVSGFGIGEVFAVLTSVAMAGMLVFSAKLLADVDALTLTAVQTGFTGLVCTAAALVLEGPAVLLTIPATGWWIMGYIVIVATLFAYLLQNYALARLPAAAVSLLMCSEPIFTAAASYLILRETLSLSGWIGAVLIMVSLVAATWLEQRSAAGAA